MKLEEQIRRHREISDLIGELEEEKKQLGQAILMEMNTPSLRMGQFVVKRCFRLTVSTTPEQARQYNAVKLEEVTDKEMIKELYKNGHPVEGVKEIEYIQVFDNS